ncbi:peptide deformylase [endosymbiont of Ridgeia piscesae]|jgi:peptide deformylase|uniref:Peptide deformylase n=2 Tax=endosymbiont of Ridgeia piscesae TaxID=54398 RepID=A0A0T5YX26_9GAMM|nr:peptide deformylase [endosymbiont of Ridgeia piscesae]KRT55100.1 peptide deformylase [endosymbiont of Ridgeia piscesae]
MATLEILKLPDPRLKQPSELVEQFDDALRAFIDDLEETRVNGPAAVGIAAPQVSDFRRVIIIDCSQTRKPVPNHGRLVLVNPEISKWDGFELGREGCLSVPDYTGNVIRAERIKLTAQDPYGEPLEFDMEGYEARALQHEVDHLDGILFVDRLVSRRTDLFQRKVYQKGGKKKQGK